MKNRRVTVLLSCILILTGFTSNSTLETDKLRSTIQKQAIQIGVLQDVAESLRLENRQLVAGSRDDKIVLATVDMLTKGATPSRWANPEHIGAVMVACKKYEYLNERIKSKQYANWRFIMAWCLNTNYDPNYHGDFDSNGAYDSGIGDLNDACLSDIEKNLPVELRGRSWFNIEKSIAGVYTWMYLREKMGMPWAYLGDKQWRYYSKITKLGA